jgi:hypothetical protein
MLFAAAGDALLFRVDIGVQAGLGGSHLASIFPVCELLLGAIAGTIAPAKPITRPQAAAALVNKC